MVSLIVGVLSQRAVGDKVSRDLSMIAVVVRVTRDFVVIVFISVLGEAGQIGRSQGAGDPLATRGLEMLVLGDLH